MRRRCVTADGLRTPDEPRIHGDGGTVVSEVRLVVFVDEVLVEQAHVAVAQLFAEHLFDALGQQTTVETNEALLGQLADEGSDVLVLHVRVGIEFRTLCGIGCLDVVHHEVQTALRVAILGVLMTIQHVCFGYLIVSLCHQSNLHLILDLFYGSLITYSQVRQDVCERFLGRKCTNC